MGEILLTRCFPNHWEVRRHRRASIHATPMCCLQKRIPETQKVWNTKTNSLIPNHWERHPIAGQRSTLSQCAACKNALQKLKGCGAFNHKIYSQSLGSTLHHEASIHTIPMCSLQNHIAEAHRVRKSTHKMFSQSLASIHTTPNVQFAKSHCIKTKVWNI